MLNRMTLQSHTVLAFDYGEKRIGVAVGNTLMKTSQPLTIIEATHQEERFGAIQDIIQEWQPTQLVVGLPAYPDGKPHSMTEKAKRFGNQLQGRFNLPVTWVDERYSSVDVDQGHDALAAQVILDQYFAELNSNQNS